MATHSIRYCAGCMSKVSDAGRCTNAGCRWDERAAVETQEHLPRHYILLDRYYIGRVLGQGGFGVTYIAQDLKLDRTVAIKEFLPKDQCSRRTDRVTVHSFSEEKGEQFRFGLERFLSEAQNIAKLGGHPNIVSITDYAEANGTAYMVMEFIPGVTLKQYLADQGGKIPYSVASEIMLHVMAGLNKAHEHGLIHRDVSPDNIMLSSFGPVKLIDFGAARQAVGEKSQNLTMVLKPGYAPEEQYRSRGVQGPWTDVYATAATLYRCITGHVPPAAPDRLAEDDLVRPSHICKDLPAAAEAAILNGLTVRANARPQTIKEFRQLLIGLTGSQPQISEIAPPPQPIQGEGETVAVQSPISYGMQTAGIRLFTPRAVWLAAFFGTPLGACIVLAINYSRLNKASSALKCIVTGTILTVAIAVGVAVVNPTSELWPPIFIGGQIGLAFAFSNLTRQWQGDQIKQNQALGARRGSYWAAFGIGLATIVMQLVIAWPIASYETTKHLQQESDSYSTGSSDSLSSPATSTTGDTTTSPPPAGPPSDSTSDSTPQTHKELSVGKGALDYWYPITDSQAQDVGKLLSGYFEDEGTHAELRRTDQGGEFVLTIASASDAQEVANGQHDIDLFWIGRAMAEDAGGYPAELHLVNTSGETLRNLLLSRFVGLAGEVENSAGSTIEDASVTVTNDSTGQSFSFQSTDLGIYQFPNLAPGSYTLDVQATGYSEYRESVEVPADGVASQNVRLTVESSQ